MKLLELEAKVIKIREKISDYVTIQYDFVAYSSGNTAKEYSYSDGTINKILHFKTLTELNNHLDSLLEG